MVSESAARDWGSYQDILAVASKFLPVPQDLLKTEWTISNEAIKKYPVQVTEMMAGGTIMPVKEYVQKRTYQLPVFMGGFRV